MAAHSDRISQLPDELLHHILSFVPTEIVVRGTVLLSRRWTNLWTSIPTIVFNYDSFSCQHIVHHSQERCFQHFILRLLSRRSSLSNVRNLISCFSNIYGFDCSNLSDDDISALTFSRNSFKYLSHFAYSWFPVEKLCIHGTPLNLSAWFSCLSTCRSMELSGFRENRTLVPPLTLNFLKSLKIENYSCKYLKLTNDMFPSCPLLQRLALRGTCFARAKITAPNLEYFEMSSRSYGYCGHSPEIVLLFTPKLACVEFDNVVPSIIISTANLLSLHKVEFSLLFSPLISQEEEKEHFAQKLRGVLDLLQCATTLTIDLNAVKVFSQYLPSPMEDEAFTFHNLRHLTLKGHYQPSLTMPNHMLNFLLHSPSLQTFSTEEDIN